MAAVVMSLRWTGVTPEQYEAARSRVRWEEDPPNGLVVHAAWFDADGLRVVDVWDGEEDWDRFVAGRIMPAAMELGIMGQPEVQYFPLHRRFVAPGVSGGASGRRS